jgi:PAS domain S-box-containing protein
VSPAASPDVVTIIDAEDIVRSVSPALGRVLGHPPDEGINVAVTDVVHPDDRAAVHDALARLRAEEVTHLTLRYQAYHRNGQWVVLESQAARLAGDDQARIVMITRDVSDRARLEQAQAEAREAAEVANRSKSEFVSRMSHELRTPLNAVLGFAQILELDELSAGQSEAVTQILKGGRHLLDLINEVLDISRIETGALTFSPEAVFVTDLLAETLALVQPLADSSVISLHANGGGACDCYVFADRQRVKQVLLNLLSNGLKYNRVGGTVTVSCVQTDDGPVRINITDTGPGIRPEHLPLLFTPFERLGAEQSGVEGTGIGLALSRHLAEAMGGMLGVTTSPGEGSTFWLSCRASRVRSSATSASAWGRARVGWRRRACTCATPCSTSRTTWPTSSWSSGSWPSAATSR